MFSANLGTSVVANQKLNYVRDNSFYRCTSMPERRRGCGCQIIDNKIYVFGGSLFSGTTGTNFTDTATGLTGIINSNDPESINWQQNYSLPARVIWPATGLLKDGRIISCGGFFPDFSGRKPPHTFIGTPTANSITWVQSTNFPGIPGSFDATWSGRDNMICTVLNDGRIFLAGGFYGNACCWDGSTYLYQLNGRTEAYLGTVSGNTISWVNTTSLPSNRWHSGACVLEDGRIVVMGGYEWSAQQRGSYPTQPSTLTTGRDQIWVGTVNGDSIAWVDAGTLPDDTSLVSENFPQRLRIAFRSQNGIVPVPSTSNKFMTCFLTENFRLDYNTWSEVPDLKYWNAEFVVEVTDDNQLIFNNYTPGTLFRNTVQHEGQTIRPFSFFPRCILGQSGTCHARYNSANRRVYIVGYPFDVTAPDSIDFDPNAPFIGPYGEPIGFPDVLRLGSPEKNSINAVDTSFISARTVCCTNRL